MDELIKAAQTLSLLQLVVLTVLLLVSGGGMAKIIEAAFKRSTASQSSKADLQKVIDERAVSMLEGFTNRQTIEIDRLNNDNKRLKEEVDSLEFDLAKVKLKVFAGINEIYQVRSFLEILAEQMSKDEVMAHHRILLRVDDALGKSIADLESCRADMLRETTGLGVEEADRASSGIMRAIGDLPDSPE